MNKYMVWTGDAKGEFFVADLVISTLDSVLFYLNGKEVKSYDREIFVQYNPSWKFMENTE